MAFLLGQTIYGHNNVFVNVLACSELALCFIPDGFHLPEALIRLIVSCRPIEKLVVVSDAAKFSGMAPGRYTANSGAMVVLSSEGRSCLASDPQVMAGSSSNMIKCMNYLSSLGILSEEELWRVGYENPLKILGLRPENLPIGRDKVGYDVELQRFKLLA